MKLILTTLISIFIATTAFSQFGIKGGFALGEPVNDNNTKNMHLGFDLGVTYDITESIRVELLLESMYRKENFGFFGNYVSRIMPITVGADRSEEHTSELQSRPHLVCRLLLEKK